LRLALAMMRRSLLPALAAKARWSGTVAQQGKTHNNKNHNKDTKTTTRREEGDMNEGKEGFHFMGAEG